MLPKLQPRPSQNLPSMNMNFSLVIHFPGHPFKVADKSHMSDRLNGEIAIS